MASPNPIDEAKELQQMLVSYAKQETLEPLKPLAKYVGLGMAGGLCFFLGLFFVALGVLRGVQRVFEGNSYASVIPYVAAVVVLAILIGLFYLAFSRAKQAVTGGPLD